MPSSQKTLPSRFVRAYLRMGDCSEPKGRIWVESEKRGDLFIKLQGKLKAVSV